MVEKCRMDIDKELDRLIFQYGIDRYNPVYRDFVKAKSMIGEIYHRLKKDYGEVVVVSEKWEDIGFFCDFADDRCKYLFVENPVQPDLESVSLFEAGICFLVISINYRDELVVRLSDKVETVLDLYDFFEDEGIYFRQNFYEIYPSGYHSFELDQKTNDYREFKEGVIFLNHRNRFEESDDLSRKEKYLGEMIFDCVYNRDFFALKDCVRTYQRMGFKDNEKYTEFMDKLEVLLTKIKQCMQERHKEDVVMYWLDALEYGDDDVMPFLKGLDETALCMDNMYTVTPTTHPTFRVLFAKRRVIEEQSYHLKKVTREDSRIVQELEKRGYNFACYGQWVKNEEDFRAKRYVHKNADITCVFWTFLKDVMLEPEKKFFAVIHELFNTHNPYFLFGYSGKYFPKACYVPGLSGNDHREQIEKQRREAYVYVDKYLEYFNGFLPIDTMKIYMSDHGRTLYGRYHVVMKVQQNGIKPYRYDDMVSFYDFDKFVLGLIDHKEVDKDLLGGEYVIIQDSEYRHHKYILDSIKNLRIDESALLGYQGVITKEDMLICYREGVTFYPEKHYRKFNNDGKIVTKSRMDYLEALISSKRIDLESSDEFSYSRICVNGLKKHMLRVKDTERKKWQVISSTMREAVTHGITAVRGGGIHTERLLMLLDGDVREKIKYIIDGNRGCEASHLGAKIISLDELNKYGVENVVISSFKYRSEWKKELEAISGLHIVDIYGELEKAGFACDRDFYVMQYVAEDFL